jgi:hypothetical protein
MDSMHRIAAALAIMAISFPSVLGSAAELGVWPSSKSVAMSTSGSSPEGEGAPTRSAHPAAASAINNRVDCMKAGGDWRFFAHTCDLGD